MNLHEVYADLMGEMNKLESEMSDVQREAIFEECMKDIKKRRFPLSSESCFDLGYDFDFYQCSFRQRLDGNS